MCGFIVRERLRFCFRAPDSSHGFGERNLLSFTNSHEHFDKMSLNPEHSLLRFRIVLQFRQNEQFDFLLGGISVVSSTPKRGPF